MGRSAILVTVIVLIVLLRLIPAFFSGSLFSTDVWPLYRGTNALLAGARVWDDRCFDGYNNHWPGVMLLAAVLSSVTGLGTHMLFAYVLTTWFSIAFAVTLYALLRRFFPPEAAAIGLAAAGFTPSFVVFTSAPLKEVMAYPIIVTALLTALKSELGKGKQLALLALLSPGLVMTHHLGTFMLLGFLVSLAITNLIYWLKGVERVRPRSHCLLVPALLLGAIFLLYYVAFGGASLKVDVGASTILGYLTYFLVIYLGFLVFAGISRGSYYVVLAVVAATAGFVFLGGYASILPGVVVSSYSIIWYVIPITAYLIVLLPGVDDLRIRIAVAGFGLFISVNVAFVVLAEPALATLFHRFANYLVFPVAALATYWFWRGGMRRFVTVAAVGLAAVSSASVFAGVFGGWDASSYWLYRSSEVAGFSDVIDLSGGATLVGDEKVRYFAIGLANVTPTPVLRMLLFNEEPPPGAVFILYSGDYRLGFVAGMNAYDVTGLFSVSSFSKVYDNGFVEALVRGGEQ